MMNDQMNGPLGFQQTLVIIQSFCTEVNEIWYPRSLIIALPGYQNSLTSYTKWRNDE